MKWIIDTNVGVVANGNHENATESCVLESIRAIKRVTQKGILVLDDAYHIIREYKQQLNQSGQPGVGDAFLKWVLTNWTNPKRCELVTIHLRAIREDDNDFAKFPDDPGLEGFDRSDRKFVATAVAHPDWPPILNAVDTDWHEYRSVLERHVRITFLCPEMMSRPSASIPS